MASTVELIFRLTGIQGVVSGIGAVTTQLDTLSLRARNVGREMQAMGNSMAGVGTRLSAGIAAPLTLATGALVRMAAEAVESENLFEVSMGGMADAARDFSEELRSELGLNAYELRRQIGIMQNFTTAMGVSTDTAFEMSTSVAALSADMASFFNISNEEAFRRIQSGLSGEIEPLRRLGIVVSDAAVQARAAAMGLTGELTDQQKVLIRYNLILEQTGNAQGDLARTIDSPANAMRILGAQFENLGIELGTAFLPSIRNVVVAIRDNVVPVLERWIEAFQNLEPRTRGFIILAGALAAALGPLLIALGGMVALMGTLLTVLGVILSPIGLLVAGIATLAATIYFARDSFDDLLVAMDRLMGFGDGTIQRFAGIIIDQIGRGIALTVDQARAMFVDFGRDVANTLQLLLRVSSVIASTAQQGALAQRIDEARTALQNFFDGTDVTEGAGNVGRAIDSVRQGFTDFRENVEETRNGIIDSVSGMADFVGGATGDIEDANAAASNSYNQLGIDAINAAGAVSGAASDMAAAAEEMSKSFMPGSGMNMLGGDDSQTAADVFKEWQEGLWGLSNTGVEVAEGLTSAFDGFTSSLSSGIGDAVGQAIVFGESFGDAVGNVAKKAVAQLIGSLVQLGVQYVLNATLAQALAGLMTAFASGQAAILAAAWAPAAAFASLASFGANAAPASAAITGTLALAQGLGKIGGKVGKFETGTDSFTATGPRLMLVGENGPERVSVDRLSAGGRNSGSPTIIQIANSIIDPLSLDQMVDLIAGALERRGGQYV